MPSYLGVENQLTWTIGMRNRFRNLAEYHNLIAAHGILAAITFLFMIPFAIFVAKFYHRNQRLALRLHIWTQILVFFFATAIFVLGWFAVGPERSLTNPHHGIGLAIYVMIIFQFLFGSWVYGREKKKQKIPYKTPLKLMVGRQLSSGQFIVANIDSFTNGWVERSPCWVSFRSRSVSRCTVLRSLCSFYTQSGASFC